MSEFIPSMPARSWAVLEAVQAGCKNSSSIAKATDAHRLSEVQNSLASLVRYALVSCVAGSRKGEQNRYTISNDGKALLALRHEYRTPANESQWINPYRYFLTSQSPITTIHTSILNRAWQPYYSPKNRNSIRG